MPDTSPELAALEQVSASPSSATIDEALAMARDLLGVELGYITEFRDDEQVYRGISGDGDSFGMASDEGYPLEGSFCKRMVLGEIPHVVPDVRADERVRDLALTQLGEVGAYIGVPVTLSDGRVWGTLCGLSHEAQTGLDERAVAFMRVLSRMVAAELERDALRREVSRLTARAAEAEGRAAQADDAGRVRRITESGEFPVIPR